MTDNKTLSPEFTGNAELPPYDFINKIEKEGDKVRIALNGMTIKITEDDVILIDNANIEINEGDKVAFTGPNGSGKSSLFRVLRGLNWDGSGTVEITKPEDYEIFCSPQELRKATITLPGILSYPNPPENYSPEAYEDALKKVGMEKLIKHLPWKAVLPDNVLHHAKEHLDNYLKPFKGKVSSAFTEDFVKKFRKVIDKKLDMPPPLKHVYNVDIHKEVVEELTKYVEQELSYNDPETGDILVLLTNRAASKTAEAVAENTRDSMDSWLLQGHRLKLSGGQQQFLVFARILLQNPEVLLLDEITSDLKENTEYEFYEMMMNTLPDSTMISIIHSEALLKLHTHHLELHEDKTLTLTPIDDAYLEARFSEKNRPKPAEGNKPPAP